MSATLLIGQGDQEPESVFAAHRSEHTQREGKSPVEILTGQEHPHCLSLLGFQPFKKTG